MADLSLEKKYFTQGLRVIGTDEVGRGCLAGPVVSASVMFHETVFESSSLSGLFKEIDDSKKLSPTKRSELAKFIREHAHVQIDWCYPHEIDKYNILHASMLAMRKTLRPFAKHAQVVLVDGHLSPYAEIFMKKLPEVNPFQKIETLVKGDSKSLSIAAASIVAKVYRDEWMKELDGLFPGYSFGAHKGYSTPVHYRAIEKLGACKIHRLSFAPFSV